jgi:predicted TIM-barrel fold metal-dependent hydrolase
MALDLFDVQSGILGRKTGSREFAAPEELLASTQDLGITRSLVRMDPPDMELDFIRSNQSLFQVCAAHPELIPCPLVVPNTIGDLPDEEEQVKEAIANQAGAVWIRPAAYHWNLAERVTGRLFSVLEQHSMPVFIAAGSLTVDETATLAGSFPVLPIIYAGVGYRDLRVQLPLLEKFKNIHLSTGNNFSVHNGIEQVVKQVGSQQLLFGTGFPASEPMAAVMQLIYADIPEADKENIAFKNPDRLVKGIK